MTNLLAAIGVAAGFVVGIIAHQAATAWVADRMGDKTPRLYGQMNLRPKAHFDVLGSIVLPAIFTLAALVGSPLGIMVGWGKRHVLNPRKRSGKAVIAPALAGPAATLLLAIAGGAVARVLGSGANGCSNVFFAVGYFTLVCVSLTVLELLPMPGRDGGAILATFLSPKAQMKMEELAQYDALFVIGVVLLLAGVFGRLVSPLFSAILGHSC